MLIKLFYLKHFYDDLHKLQSVNHVKKREIPLLQSICHVESTLNEVYLKCGGESSNPVIWFWGNEEF